MRPNEQTAQNSIVSSLLAERAKALIQGDKVKAHLLTVELVNLHKHYKPNRPPMPLTLIRNCDGTEIRMVAAEYDGQTVRYRRVETVTETAFHAETRIEHLRRENVARANAGRGVFAFDSLYTEVLAELA